jgi:hypothetical protein
MARRKASWVRASVGSPCGRDNSVIRIKAHFLVGIPDRGLESR